MAYSANPHFLSGATDLQVASVYGSPFSDSFHGSSTAAAPMLTYQPLELQSLEGEPGSSSSSCCQVCLCNGSNVRLCYNAKVCDSCRVFFRRTVISPKSQGTMICKNPNPGQCQVTGAKRPVNKSCKKCRFDRCLRLGMKLSLVSIPKKKPEISRAVSRPIIKAEFQEEQAPLLAMSCTLGQLSLKEHQHWFQQNFKKKTLQEACRVYLKNLTLFHELMLANYHGQSISSDLFNWFKHILGQTTLKHLNTEGLINQGSLNPHDHAVLVRARGPIVMEALNLMAFWFKKDLLQSQFNWLSAIDPGNVDLQLVLSMMSYYKSTNKIAKPGIRYNQVYLSPWAENQDLEDSHSVLVAQQLQIFQHFNNFDVDIVMVVLLVTIFYSPDEPGIIDGSDVLRIREAGLKFAHQLLSSICGSEEEGMVKIKQFLKLIPLLHESSEISRKRLPV